MKKGIELELYIFSKDNGNGAAGCHYGAKRDN